MSFTLSIFLYAYYAFLAVWAVFFAVAVYHMFKYGFKTLATYLFTVLFVSVAALFLVMSFGFISTITWDTGITILEETTDFSF